MIINKVFCSFFCALIFSSFSGFTQSSTNDTIAVVGYIKNAHSFYKDAVRETLPLYIGSEYVSSDNRIDGDPYFLSEDFEEGTIVYFDQVFETVPVLYDIYTDELITEHFNQVYKLRLSSEKVASFSYLGNHFIRIAKDSLLKTTPKTGFYHSLYDGEVKIFAKRKKTIFETIQERKVHKEYVSNNSYYIKKDNVFYTVKTKKSALAPFKEFKKELNKELRKNKLKFSRDKEKFLIVIAEEYDKISRK